MIVGMLLMAIERGQKGAVFPVCAAFIFVPALFSIYDR
jgi:hypothetical protein